jgi:hypothetical protein
MKVFLYTVNSCWYVLFKHFDYRSQNAIHRNWHRKGEYVNLKHSLNFIYFSINCKIMYQSQETKRKRRRKSHTYIFLWPNSKKVYIIWLKIWFKFVEVPISLVFICFLKGLFCFFLEFSLFDRLWSLFSIFLRLQYSTCTTTL